MIQLLPAEEAEIAAVRAAFVESEFNAWFDQSAIKARVKKACMQRQRLRCCYCRKYKDTTNSNEWDLEHILCKLWYPQFVASPANLAIACKPCNIAKSEQDVLRPQPRPNPRIEAVPTETESYAIPHPWVDDWDAYLRHVNFQIYLSETPKGLELIRLCKLNKIAVDDGGLTYESVIAAMKTGFFDIVDNPIEPPPPDAEILTRVARMTDTLHDLQTEARLVALGKTLTTQGRKAGRRTPDQAVAEAAQLFPKESRVPVETRYRDIAELMREASVERAAPALPAPPLALPPPDEREASE